MNRGIQDRVIRTGVQKFVDNWQLCNRRLHGHGYISSNIDTLHLAQRMLADDEKGVDSIKKATNDIDYNNLNKIISLHKADQLTFIAMHYPILSDFKAFYYKKIDNNIQNLMYEYCGEEMASLSISNRVDVLDDIKTHVRSNETLYEKICDEIEVLETVQDFMDVSDDVSYVINKQIQSHVNAAKAELKRAEKNMLAGDYLQLERRRTQQLQELSTRTTMILNLMLNLTEN